MPHYKHRKIELTPSDMTTGRGSARIAFEFKSTSWVFYKGCAKGDFASRDEAAVAALEEANGASMHMKHLRIIMGKTRHGFSYLLEKAK